MSKKNEPKTSKKSAKVETAKPTFKDFRALMNAVADGQKPRGLKVALNPAGGVTATFGKESIVASKDDVLSACLAVTGVKLDYARTV